MQTQQLIPVFPELVKTEKADIKINTRIS